MASIKFETSEFEVELEINSSAAFTLGEFSQMKRHFGVKASDIVIPNPAGGSDEKTLNLDDPDVLQAVMYTLLVRQGITSPEAAAKVNSVTKLNVVPVVDPDPEEKAANPPKPAGKPRGKSAKAGS